MSDSYHYRMTSTQSNHSHFSSHPPLISPSPLLKQYNSSFPQSFDYSEEKKNSSSSSSSSNSINSSNSNDYHIFKLHGSMYQESVYIDEQLNTKKRNTHSLTQSLQGKPFSSARFRFLCLHHCHPNLHMVE